MINPSRRHIIEKNLNKARRELKALNESAFILQSEKPSWKQSLLQNNLLQVKRNSLVELSELLFPWYISLERKSTKESLDYQELYPFSIRLFHVVRHKSKPFQIQVSCPKEGELFKKSFSTLEKATKYAKKMKGVVEKKHVQRLNNIDEEIKKKELEIQKLEESFNVFCNNQNKSKLKKIN